MSFTYETCCVNSTAEAIHAMQDKAREVSLHTFTKRCDWRPWARAMTYAVDYERGLHLRHDRHVRYFRSRYQGRRCYYAVHSAIEYIFTEPKGPQ